ncbi:MAG TPA: HypC/HybG/HupF family hydrogenase formation chaperone [Desulfobacteraceae bacterium]|nr:HypC/HybG/HupF family hydrogenase formation chaperone [Desulfobacteraceae bacterium]
MCIAVPSKIIKIIDAETGIVDAGGVKKKISLVLLEEPFIGEYVIVHAGFAIAQIDIKEAEESLRLIREAAVTIA